MHRTGWLSRTETRRGGREQKYCQGTYRMEMQLSLLGDFGIWWRVRTSVSFCGVKVVGCLCTTTISHECSLLWWVAISCPHYSDAYLLLLLSLGSWDGTCSWETTEGLDFFSLLPLSGSQEVKAQGKVKTVPETTHCMFSKTPAICLWLYFLII